MAVKKQKRLLDVLRQQVAVLDSAAAVRAVEAGVADFGVGDSGGEAQLGGGGAGGGGPRGAVLTAAPVPRGGGARGGGAAAGFADPYAAYAAAIGAEEGEFAEYG